MNWREIPLADVIFHGNVNYISIKEINIKTKTNSYAKAVITLVLMEGEENIAGLKDSRIELSIKGKPLFCGICSGCQLLQQDSYYELQLEAKSYSYLADKQKKNQTFQNPGKTFDSIFQKLLSSYNGTLHIQKDISIPRVISQKNETDWEFLVRIANQEKLCVFENVQGSHMFIEVGNEGSQYEELGTDAVLLEEGKCISAMRNEMANGYAERGEYEYQYAIYACNNIGAMAGCICETGMITASEICSDRGVLKNIVTIAGAEECLPELEAQRTEAFSSRILTGKVAKVDVSTIQVEFDDEEGSDAMTEIPYASVMSNSFYTMPEIDDKVFVYADNQGEIVCLGSKRTDTNDKMFDCPTEKSFGALDSVIHFGTENIDISASRMAYSKEETESEITISMTPEEGLTIISPEKIRIDSDDKIILAVTPESDSMLSAKTKIQMSKRMLCSSNSIAKAASASEYKPLTTVPSYDLSDYFSEEGHSLREDNEWDNFKTNMANGALDMVFYNWWKKDTPLELNSELGEYENGCLIANTYTIELKVGNVQLRMGIARTNTIEIYAGSISWYGTEQTENYPIKQDELRDAWEMFMDVVTAVVGIAATVVAVVALFVGTGGVGAIAVCIGAAAAAVSFARGDYFGAITSTIGAVAGGLGQIPKFTKFFTALTKATSPLMLIHSLGQTGYQLPTAWNLMKDRINAQETNLGKFAEGFCGFVTLLNIGTSWVGDGADVLDSYVTPKLNGGNTTPGSTDINESHIGTGGDDQTHTNLIEGENTQNSTHDGDPVNVATGALTERHTDLRLKDIRGDFRVVRSYKSTKKNPGRMLGERWLFQFESSLYRAGSKCSIYLPDDHLEHFILNEAGKWSNVVSEKNRYLLTSEQEGYLLCDMESHNSYFYGKDGFIRYAMDEFQNRTLYTYDGTLLKRITLESGQYLDFYYEGKKLARLVDGQGRKYEYHYDGELLKSVTYPNGGILQYEYTPEGYITRIHNENGKVYLNNFYDRKGRVVRQETADGEEYIFFYNDAGKETTVTKVGLNRSVKYRYNRNDLVECTTFEDGTTIEKNYDANEKIVWEKDRLGNITSRSFNEYGQIISVTYPNGLETVFTYNEQRKCVAVTDNQGKNCQYIYNEKGAVSEVSIEVEKGRYATIKYELDEHGRILSQIYGDGAKKTWVYQKPFLHPTAYCSAENDEIQYELDEYGRVSVIHNEDGEIQYAYNSLHFVTMICDEEDNVTRYTYDLTGLRTGMKKPEDVVADDGVGITYKYDAMDHLLGVEDACGNVYARKVNSEGRLLKLIDPTTYDNETKDGEGVTYKYDVNGYCTHRILRDGAVYRFFHDANGNMVKMVLPEDYDATTDNGAGRSFTYDSMNRLLTVHDKQGILIKKNTYDLAGRLVAYSNARMASFGTDSEEEIAAHYKYNQVGWLVEERIPMRKNDQQVEYRLRTYEYDMRGNVTCEKRYLDYQNAKSMKGRVLLIHKKYDKNGRLIKVTDSLGACMEYAYNERNKLCYEKMKIREGIYQEKKYTYTNSGRLAAITQSADAKETSGGTSITRILYDRNGKIVQLTTPIGNEIFYTYDRAGRKTGIEMVQHDGKIKNTVQFAYDRGNRMIQKTVDGRTEHYTYDACGRRSTIQNMLGKTSLYKYDKNGRLTGYIAPKQYDEGGVAGKAVTYLYENDRLTKILLPDGSCKKEFGYNDYGDNISIKESGIEAAFTYDLGRRKTLIKSSGKASQQQEYDPWGRVTEVTDGNGNSTGFELDGWGRTLQVNRADGGVETFAYDDAGNMIEAVDGLGNTTRFEYNEMNHLARRIDPAGEEELWNYNAEGRIKRYQDRNGNEILFDYNMYGELTRRSSSDGMEEVFGYTKEGLLDYCIGGGMRYDYCYDSFGRLAEKKASGRTLISYEYDDYSQMTSRTDLTGKCTEYHYDEVGRLLQVFDDGVEQAAYSYDEKNRLSEQISGALKMSYAYDMDGNISRTHSVLADEDLFDNHYQYDANGNCTRIERKDSVTEYAYDCMNRLAQAVYPNHAERFEYDYADNRVSREYYAHFDMHPEAETIGKTGDIGELSFREEYLYDERNCLTERHIMSADSLAHSPMAQENSMRTSLQDDIMQSIHYTYDANGNLINDENAEYHYDSFNRLSEVRTLEGNYQRNTYDAEGLRAQLLENNELVRFLYHNGEVITETNDKQETTRYIRGLGLISSDSEKAKTYYHYVSDERGSITDIVKMAVKKKLSEDAKKKTNSRENLTENAVEKALRKLREKPAVLNHYEYDAFGNALVCEEKIANRFRFTGEIYDSVTGQYYLRARFYNPVLGRFTQEDDRYDDGMNLYAYCRNNPVKYTDPSGHGTTSGPDRDSQADFYVSPDGTVVPGDTIYVAPDGTAIPGSQFNPDANNPNPNGSNTQSQGTNQSSLFDLVDEMNQTGGCDSTDQSIIHDWADEYGVDYDSLGINAKSESGSSSTPKTLYHYTNEKGMTGIVESKKLNPSLKANNPNDCFYGEGQYLSDIVPGTKSPAQLSRSFIHNPFQGAKYAYYVEIDVTDLDVVYGRDNVFVILNQEPLDLMDRIVSYGKVGD